MLQAARERRLVANRTTAKAEETRERILNSALDLFRDHGFDQTTMRQIAVTAEVATGAAYYYFDSKEALVLAYYQRARDEMRPRIEAALAGKKDLKTLLQAIIVAKFETFAPNRLFLGALLGHVANPTDPLSPFSAQTQEIRETDIRYFSDALDASGVRVPKDLRDHLPRLLWMYQMGLILFWVYDRSAGEQRTARLFEKSLAMVVIAIKLASVPLMRPLRRAVVELLETVSE
jgi:AcrR family transcriptional regulator